MKFRTVETLAGLIIASLIAGSPPVSGQESVSTGQEDRATYEPSPSIELLEFLGEWETDEGHWIDPTQFDPTPANDSEMENETWEDD